MAPAYTITLLSTTPVKGLALHHPRSISLTRHGAAGDRRFYLVDESGKLQSCTRNPELYGLTAAWDQDSRRLQVSRGADLLVGGVIEPDRPVGTDLSGIRTLEADTVADPRWDAFFSDLLGLPVSLVQARESAFDVQPVTLLGTGSVDELARRSGLPHVDPRRFRMLIQFEGGDPHAEDSWDGCRLEVGGAVLRAGGPVKRCAATTRHPDTGSVDLQTLRLITDYRGRQESEFGAGAHFGVYASVLEPGTITVGDTVEVAARSGRGGR